jgi:prophage antirepressor-like protein
MKTIFETLDENYISFDKTKINVIIDNSDKIWFCARELIIALEYKDIKDVIKKHIQDDDKIQLKYINHSINIKLHPNTIFINESGLYKLVFKSKMKKAKIFTKWVTNEVLPSIRKFGYYKLKNTYEKQNKLMTNDLKKEKYPDGALVYIIDYSNDDNYEENVFRLGSTNNLNKRKQIYNTHTLHKKKVIDKYFTKKTLQFKNCTPIQSSKSSIKIE